MASSTGYLDIGAKQRKEGGGDVTKVGYLDIGAVQRLETNTRISGRVKSSRPKSWGTVKPPSGATVNWGNPLSRGMTGCWLFNEGAGNKAKDIASLNNGTLVNTALWTPGKFGKAVSLNGSTSNVNTFKQSISPVGPRSISIWFNVGDTTRDGLIANQASSNGWALAVNRTSAGNLTYYHNPAGLLEVAAGIVVNRWFHAVITYQGGTARMYVNGRLIGTDALFTVDSASAYTGIFGVENQEGTGPFLGKLDNIRIYKRVLTLAEVQELYRNPFVGINVPRKRTFGSFIPSSPPAASATGIMTPRSGWWGDL